MVRKGDIQVACRDHTMTAQAALHNSYFTDTDPTEYYYKSKLFFICQQTAIKEKVS